MNAEKNKTATLREKFSNWFASPLGKRVFTAEVEELQDILPDMFGYHILQYSYSAESNYINASRIADKTVLFLDESEIQNSLKAIYTSAEELPIASDSIDVIVLPHILEYSKDAHKLLREMDRVLIGDGRVVIIGINPISLWGLWHLFLCWWGNMPWSGRLISIPKIKDWLSLLDFDVKKTKCFFFSPPLRSEKWLNKLIPLERLGHYCWPILGGLYVIVAKKRVIPLNPIKMHWTAKRKILGSGVIEPTTRSSLKNNG
ncbi:MAG: methyltransferase domain-containing protein [Proteobacteria bacterium]|nr:methyltransferase domain-containing protein [Pseudomonadota bacterium]